MPEALKVRDHSVLRATPTDKNNGTIVLYFSPTSIDPNDPTQFCRDSKCPWLQAKGRLKCKGPAPAAYDQVIAQVLYENMKIPVFRNSINGLVDESACGADVTWINHSRMARGG